MMQSVLGDNVALSPASWCKAEVLCCSSSRNPSRSCLALPCPSTAAPLLQPTLTLTLAYGAGEDPFFLAANRYLCSAMIHKVFHCSERPITRWLCLLIIGRQASLQVDPDCWKAQYSLGKLWRCVVRCFKALQTQYGRLQ